MPEILPCLWFDGRAEAAMNLDLAIFPNARVTDVKMVELDIAVPQHAADGT